MNRVILFSIILSLSLFSACNSTKKQAKNTSKEVKTSENEIMKKEGFKIGVVNFNEDGRCVYTITDQSTNVIYDPVNFMEIAADNLRFDAVTVYFKFRPLRMMNRCENLQPIEITEIKKRED